MHEWHYIISRDSDMIKEWRRDRRSFDKSMEKVSRRNEGTLTTCTKLDLLIYYWEIYLLDDIPFAIDIKDYPAINEKQKVVW